VVERTRGGKAYIDMGKVVVENIEKTIYEGEELVDLVNKFDREIRTAQHNLSVMQGRIDSLIEQRNDLKQALEEMNLSRGGE